VGVAHSLEECHRVGGTGSHVEADANDVETKLVGQGKEAVGGIHGGTKLHAKPAQAGSVVGHDTKEELRAGIELGDLVKLVGIVKSHLLDANRLDVSDVGIGLAWLGVDDALRAGAHAQNLLNLSLGSAVEAGTKFCKKPKHLGVGVAFDRWRKLASEQDVHARGWKEHSP
jgi:hypothetical protein